MNAKRTDGLDDRLRDRALDLARGEFKYDKRHGGVPLFQYGTNVFDYRTQRQEYVVLTCRAKWTAEYRASLREKVQQ